MQGLWKSNVPEWKKDCRRKINSKNKFLKDKINYFSKHKDEQFEEHILKNENKEFVLVGEKKVLERYRAHKLVHLYPVIIYDTLVGIYSYHNKNKKFRTGKAFSRNDEWYEWPSLKKIETTCIRDDYFNPNETKVIKNPFYKEDKEKENEIVEKEFNVTNKKIFLYKKEIKFKEVSYSHKYRKTKFSRRKRQEIKTEIKTKLVEEIDNKYDKTMSGFAWSI